MFEYDSNYDVAVIGGGLAGCLTARELRKFNLNVVLLEAREDLCTGLTWTGNPADGEGQNAFPEPKDEDLRRLCEELGAGLSEEGTVIPWELGIAAGESFVINGGYVYFNCRVSTISKLENAFMIKSENRTVQAKGIINCAGLFAEEVMRMPAKQTPGFGKKLASGSEQEAGFLVAENERFISLLPAGSASPERDLRLAEKAAQTMAEMLQKTQANPDFKPKGLPIPRFSRASEKERARLLNMDPAYGDIICQCRQVTRAEIIESVRRGAVNVGGVKRRTGACTGSCQGRDCKVKIKELIAQELSLTPSEIEDEGKSLT